VETRQEVEKDKIGLLWSHCFIYMNKVHINKIGSFASLFFMIDDTSIIKNWTPLESLFYLYELCSYK